MWQKEKPNQGVTVRFKSQGEDGARADPGGLRVRDHSRDARHQQEREGVARMPGATTPFVLRLLRRCLRPRFLVVRLERWTRARLQGHPCGSRYCYSLIFFTSLENFLRNNIHWSIGWRDKWPWKTEIGAPICNLPAVVYPAAMPLPHSSPLKPVDEPKVHFCPPSWWSVVASRSFFSIVYATPSESPIRPSLLSLLLLS